MKPLYPVILSVPDSKRLLKGREKTSFLSSHARKALKISAVRAGMGRIIPQKDEKGVPKPYQGIFWSIAHKPEFVSGVVSCDPVGIDIEKIRSYKPGLASKVGSDEEWSLGDEEKTMLFFRFWTAKEAVLKSQGVGLAGLSRCKVTEIPGPDQMILQFANGEFLVEHCYFSGHVAAIVKNKSLVDWQIIDQ